MKKMLLFTLLCPALYLGCSKNDDNKNISDCGVVITQSLRNDGGVQERIGLVACGDSWHSLEGTNIQLALLFDKGEPRRSAPYLVAAKSDTIYIRYENGNVPQSTIDSFMNIGYTTKVATLTGLEHIKWP